MADKAAEKAQHKERLQNAWEEFDRTGDGDAFLGICSDDVVYHIGMGPFAGDHRGKQKIADLFSGLQEMTGGSARGKAHAILYDDENEHSVTLAENRFTADGETHPILFAHVAHLRGGLINELWTLSFSEPNLPQLLERLKGEGKRVGR